MCCYGGHEEGYSWPEEIDKGARDREPVLSPLLILGATLVLRSHGEVPAQWQSRIAGSVVRVAPFLCIGSSMTLGRSEVVRILRPFSSACLAS